jgi:hypothetical protein
VAQGVELESESKGGLEPDSEGEHLDVGQEFLRVLLEIKRDVAQYHSVLRPGKELELDYSNVLVLHITICSGLVFSSFPRCRYNHHRPAE